jgi:hypothetical protein
MSMMEELSFFLDIQVKQMKQGTFIHQVKYTKKLMKKFNMVELKSVSTPMSTTTVLDPDENGDAVDQREYRSMIGLRLDIQFVMCLCVRFQTSLRSSHRTAVHRIFKYLKQTLEFGIWYSASSLLDLVSFSDTDLTSCFTWKQVRLGFPSLASRMVEAWCRWCTWHHRRSCMEMKLKTNGSIRWAASDPATLTLPFLLY